MSGDKPSVSDLEPTAVERYKMMVERRKVAPPSVLDPAPDRETDTMWRGLARGGEMRFLVARCTRAVDENCNRLGCGMEASRLLSETLVASLLLRSTLNPDEQLQLIARNDGPAGRIIADVWADEGMRATIQHAELPVGLGGLGDGNLEVSRSRGGVAVYRSTVPLQGSIAASVMHFLLSSEQIVSLLRIERAFVDGALTFAGGYLVQMMPEGSHEDLAQLVTNLERLPSLQAGMTEEDPDGRLWASALMERFYWDQIAREPVLFRCRCGDERVMAMLSALPREELLALIEERQTVESTCEYCGTTYRVSQSQLRGLLSEPS